MIALLEDRFVQAVQPCYHRLTFGLRIKTAKRNEGVSPRWARRDEAHG